MCKEMPLIPVNRAEYSEKWRAEEEERHKGSLTQKSVAGSALRGIYHRNLSTRRRMLKKANFFSWSLTYFVLWYDRK
jgi:hypothetical protein